MKKKIIIIAAIVIAIAFGFVIFKITSNKVIEHNSDEVLLTIGTMEPDNSKSFIFYDSGNSITLVKGYTGITGKFTITSSETISNKKYNNLLKQVENATKCENAHSNCYSITFNGQETYFVEQSDINLKY